jgi:tetratricopeptide (TPR) repeat protein
MPVVSSIFLVIALVMAVVIGPQTRSWTWGPAMLSLGLATLAALPIFWSRDKRPADFGFIAFGSLATGWFVFRAWVSPVAELGQADLLLTAAVVATYVCIRAIEGHSAAERVLIWGIALLLLANVVVAGMQVSDPSFTPVFRERATNNMVTGFYAHYNEAANYFIGSSMLVGAAGLFGRHATTTRVLWVLIAVAGLACVWFTRSRGGIFGVAVGTAVFAIVALMMAKRQGARWFGPALIAIPLIGLAIGSYLFIGWRDAQELRSAGSGLRGLFDNTARLYFLGVAFSCISLHPWIGGGSRSFSWECFQFVDAKGQGDLIANKPELVHNELLQAATDYGLVGAGLVSLVLVILAGAVILRVLFEDVPGASPNQRDAWRLGALASLAGMFVQSSFSFVFHLLPGILLLGICLGQMSCRAKSRGGVASVMGARILLTISAVACCLALFAFGWKGTQVTRILWPTYFSKLSNPSAESSVDALTEAIRLWPQSEFLQDRAAAQLMMAASNETDPSASQAATEAAIHDYQEASRLHAYDPANLVNSANLLSELRRDAEAEAAYDKAIALQGGMEPAFRGHFSLANHLMHKGLRQFQDQQVEDAVRSLELAVERIEIAVKNMHWIIADMREPRLSIHESLGAALEAAGDVEGALASYEFAASLPNGNRAHYRAGTLMGKMAAEAWAGRRAPEALGLFIKARHRIAISSQLPEGVSPARRMEYLAYLDQTIAFLKGAKVVPVE